MSGQTISQIRLPFTLSTFKSLSQSTILRLLLKRKSKSLPSKKDKKKRIKTRLFTLKARYLNRFLNLNHIWPLRIVFSQLKIWKSLRTRRYLRITIKWWANSSSSKIGSYARLSKNWLKFNKMMKTKGNRSKKRDGYSKLLTDHRSLRKMISTRKHLLLVML